MRKQYYKTCVNCGKNFETERKNQECCSYHCSRILRFEKKKKDILQEPIIQAWACGGGVQSTAIAALIVQGELMKPDYAYMIDCGYEKESTKYYIENVLIPELEKIDLKLNIIKSNGMVIRNNSMIAIPAYEYTNNKVIKYPTQCNSDWKLSPARKWLREQNIERCDNWVGISWDEKHRQRESNKWWIQNKYPLCELKLTRQDCKNAIKEVGWLEPKRSSCFICPLQSNAEWYDLKTNHLKNWMKAIEIEKEIQQYRPNVYLHKSCVSLENVDFSKIIAQKEQRLLFA